MEASISEFINPLIEKNLYKRYYADLLAAKAGKSATPLLNTANAELGLLLTGYLTDLQKEPDDPISCPEKDSSSYNRIWELLGTDCWENPNHLKLLQYFLGEPMAGYAVEAWHHIRFEMYQKGYYRRSFRAPENPEAYKENQLRFMIEAIGQCWSRDFNQRREWEYTWYKLTLPDQLKYAHYIGLGGSALPRIWAAAINSGNAGVFEQAKAIIYNEDETGKVTRNLLKALLYSEKPEAWKMVEDLLLAAKQQEGLRQTILEALDETSIGALVYMLEVIVRENLVRFSSVIRATDVWVGLSWESAKEATVRKVLEAGLHYLKNAADIPQAIQLANNTDVYMALWAQGVLDVEKTIPLLKYLLEYGNVEKRVLALLFAGQTGVFAIDIPMFMAGLKDKDTEPMALSVVLLNQKLNQEKTADFISEHYPDLFDELLDLHRSTTIKSKEFSGSVFSWMSFKFERKDILTTMIKLVQKNEDRLEVLVGLLDEMDAGLKTQLSWKILPGHTQYGYYPDNTKSTITPLQRNYALKILSDRSEFGTAFKALYFESLTLEELSGIPELLKRKGADFRSGMIEFLLRQPVENIAYIIDRLTTNGDAEQRLAALDLMLALKAKGILPDKLKEWASLLSERKSISSKEQILLEQITAGENIKVWDESNGYGLYNPDNLYHPALPYIDSGSLYARAKEKNEYGLSMPLSKITKAFDALAAFLEENKSYEYEITNWDNSKQMVLLGNTFLASERNPDKLSKEEIYYLYPLPEVWKKWVTDWGLKPVDLFIIDKAATLQYEKLVDYLKPFLPVDRLFFPEKYRDEYYYQNKLLQIVQALRLIFPFEKRSSFSIGACIEFFRSLPAGILEYKDNENYYGRVSGWQEFNSSKVFLEAIDERDFSDAELKSYWELRNWFQFSGLAESRYHHFPPFTLFCFCFQKSIIKQDDLVRGMLTKETIKGLTEFKRPKPEWDLLVSYPFLKPMVEHAVNHILDIEIKRGDSPTSVTHLATGIQTVGGINRLVQLLAGLGKTGFLRGYYWAYSSSQANKQESFSVLIKRCRPLDSETQDDFNRAIKHAGITETRLIELAIYAPQWHAFISNYLGWKGLDSAVWWMHAHTKTDGYVVQNAEIESEIARYSTLDVGAFKEGAVDKDWFWQAFKGIGKERWPIVYDAAKYISEGNGHRRARIYADVLQGITGLEEVKEKISAKRDQDYVRVYGLSPLPKSNAQKEILSRYEFLEQFKKESKQFGSQKQASEANAYRVGMENLARSAGYPDPVRLQWDMEAKQVQQILSKETQVKYGDTSIGLIIDEEGIAEVVAFKGEEQLKAIPAKLKKDSKVLELLEFRKTLREQHKRARKALEEAMVRGDLLLASEVTNLFSHPVIYAHVSKLVWVIEKDKVITAHGFYFDGILRSAEGKEFNVEKSDLLRIAHAVDLFKTGQWHLYQHYLFDKKISQPFKQVFRELYKPTPDELAEVAKSRRYAGHQVQPKKTVALLKSRGWKVDYEEGLQKLFKQEGFVAKMYAMADWFSPAEMEAPTLETVEFIHTKTWKNVPIAEIEPRIFSEVMRDIDLVVSVAHAGGVDPEASHSTIEMRTVLVQETLRLFKIGNVELKGSHALIKGTLGDYSIHLGSGVVHKIASGYVSIIPVHSQHRGRIFLPFADEDPKMAEIMAKILLLAKDDKIQDPTILSQLN